MAPTCIPANTSAKASLRTVQRSGILKNRPTTGKSVWMGLGRDRHRIQQHRELTFHEPLCVSCTSREHPDTSKTNRALWSLLGASGAAGWFAIRVGGGGECLDFDRDRG